MKSLKQQIKENFLIDKNVNSHVNEPEVGETAWDYNGDAWEILDFCKIKDKQKLKKLINKYDYSGCFADFMEEINNEYEPNEMPEYAVAATSIDNSDTEIWVWGSDGLCYENE